MTKRTSTFICVAFMVALLTMNASATTTEPRRYEVAAPSFTFGKATSTEFPVAKDDTLLNIRRNKDVALAPPPYGVFSGEIPTEQLSLYHSPQKEEEAFSKWADSIATTADGRITTSTSIGDFLPPTTVTTSTTKNSKSYNSTISTTSKSEVITESSYNDDGSIGKLSIPHLEKSVKIYEDTSVESMRKGLGHFKYTSAWDGNVGLAGHNRGNYAYFSFLKDLKKGDRVEYTTPRGTRTYAVTGTHKISVDDTSYLGWADKNQLTMITCIANEPLYRLCVVAREE